MLHIWRSICLCAFISIASILPVHGQPFENTAIVRQVELGGSIVHVTTTYAVKALEAGLKEYTIAVSPSDKHKISWMEARIKGHSKPLKIKEHGFNSKHAYHLLEIELPVSLGLHNTTNIVFEAVQTRTTFPWPEKAAQNEDQALKYPIGLFVLSPYKTVVQRTKIKSPSPRIISYSEPHGLEAFTSDAPASKSGATITYGPFNHIPPSANNDFVREHQKMMVVHYNYDHPVLKVTKLVRSAEISHWGANLNIQDEIRLNNAGPGLKGKFSRLDHQAQAFYKRPAPHVLPSLTLHLPPGIRNTYYYDQIGNVSTSKLRPAPSVPKGSKTKQYSLMELRPRYPLMGGWNYTFTLGWDSPLADSATYDKDNGQYIVEVPIMTVIPGAVVNDAAISIILPEGAKEIQYFTPFSPQSNWITTHKTYLDTTGRPKLAFVYRQLTPKHDGSIFVAYKVPASAHLKKPAAVATAFMSLFILALISRRIDLRIHKM